MPISSLPQASPFALKNAYPQRPKVQPRNAQEAMPVMLGSNSGANPVVIDGKVFVPMTPIKSGLTEHQERRVKESRMPWYKRAALFGAAAVGSMVLISGLKAGLGHMDPLQSAKRSQNGFVSGAANIGSGFAEWFAFDALFEGIEFFILGL